MDVALPSVASLCSVSAPPMTSALEVAARFTSLRKVSEKVLVVGGA